MTVKKPAISVIILTFNEELHIERCIRSLLPIAQQIFVVDSFSTDATCSIAQGLGAVVLQNVFLNQSAQFQWGLRNCTIRTDWLMRMDADEYIEPALADEIAARFEELPDDLTGIFLKRKHHFLGRWIKHGDRYPLILLRIWKVGYAHIESRWMDEHIVLNSGQSVILNGNFVDDNLNTIGWFIEKHNNYASREMLEIIHHRYRIFDRDYTLDNVNGGQARFRRFVKERFYNHLPIFVRPILYFFYRYFLRLGFLDGKEGFAYHFMQGLWYRCLVDLKCLEAEKALNGALTTSEKIERLSMLTGLKLQ